MAVISSGTIGLQNGINSVFGRGASTINYRGTTYWYKVPIAPIYSSGASATFPSVSLSLEYFYGTAPNDEFENPPPVDCVACAACSK
jgi:hypothetical protein